MECHFLLKKIILIRLRVTWVAEIIHISLLFLFKRFEVFPIVSLYRFSLHGIWTLLYYFWFFFLVQLDIF